MKADFFQPIHPMRVQGNLGQAHMMFGLNKLEYTAAAIAGPMLTAQLKDNQFNELAELKKQDTLDTLAIIAVDLAKAILQRCQDELTVEAQQAKQPGILKTM